MLGCLSHSAFMVVRYLTTGEASATFSGFPDPFTASWLTPFTFKAGMLKDLLLPPLMPLHLPQPIPSSVVHVKAPTHGWTFHPSSSVTLEVEDS